MLDLKKCNLCPRACGVDRESEIGRCRAGVLPRVARAAPHFWEEPCISGGRGSGAVFFCGCNLGCIYCQNHEISRGGAGKPLDAQRLCEVFLSLEKLGVHNINLVTPTPHLVTIAQAHDLARDRIGVPFVYNTGGYETAEAVESAARFCDVFLTDLKYFSPELSGSLSGAPDYFDKAFAAAKLMIELCGEPRFENGLLKRGVIIRHLVLPGLWRDSLELLDRLFAGVPANSFVLSLMRQYTPPRGAALPEKLRREITTYEYEKVVGFARTRGVTAGYVQQRGSVGRKFTPAFDLTGV